jgi:hypothetical protein
LASEIGNSSLTLLSVQQQANSVFHAKRTFQFKEEFFLPPIETDSSALHSVSSLDLGIRCSLFDGGGFYPENIYALKQIEHSSNRMFLTFETFRNMFFSRAVATISCEPLEPSNVLNEGLESILLSDFIEFFGAIEPINSL